MTSLQPSPPSPTSVSGFPMVSSPSATSQIRKRKPYTKSRVRSFWTVLEHERFLEALDLYPKQWKLIAQHVGTRDVTQVRSHAQKHFLRLERAQKRAQRFSAEPSSPALNLQPMPPNPVLKPVPPPSPVSARSAPSTASAPSLESPPVHRCPPEQNVAHTHADPPLLMLSGVVGESGVTGMSSPYATFEGRGGPSLVAEIEPSWDWLADLPPGQDAAEAVAGPDVSWLTTISGGNCFVEDLISAYERST